MIGALILWYLETLKSPCITGKVKTIICRVPICLLAMGWGARVLSFEHKGFTIFTLKMKEPNYGKKTD
jgi:hypothetical protein